MIQDEQASFDRLCAFVEGRMKQKGVPGVALGILYQGQTYTAGFGVTNVDHPLAVTDETLFQIGSITKTFTCLALMRLVEAGKLDLHATVRTYLPDFRVADETASARATIWHLLTHVSGWVGDLFEDTGTGADALSKYIARMSDLTQLAPIGTVWSYNNASFSLAGYVIEKVTGQCYEQAMQELVFGPLGLERCYFGPSDVMTHRFAVGHGGEGEAHVSRPWPLPRAVHPAGGIVCDVNELLRYARFQMGSGTVQKGNGSEDVQVLQPETMALMHAPQASRWGDREQMGLSWFIDDIGPVRQLSHGGGTVGQVTLLAMLPERQLALAVLTNAGAGGAVTEDVRRWVLKHYLDVEDPEPKPIEASEKELAAYVGFYTRPMADIELGMLCGQLVGQTAFKQGFPSQDAPPPPPPPPPVHLALCARDRLIITGGPGKGGRAEIIRHPDGTIGWLRMGRIHRRVDRPTQMDDNQEQGAES